MLKGKLLHSPEEKDGAEKTFKTLLDRSDFSKKIEIPY